MNVLVHAYGEDWLIDSGLYNHNRRDPIRIYMRSARAHNVPFVAGAKIDRSSVGKNFVTLKRMEAPGFSYAVKAGDEDVSAGIGDTLVFNGKSGSFSNSRCIFGL